jgi:hypothetical protein
MAKVSNVPFQTFATKLGERSGGKNSLANRTVEAPDSLEKNADHFRSRLTKLATTNTKMPNTNQHARQRALNNGGGKRKVSLAAVGGLGVMSES